MRVIYAIVNARRKQFWEVAIAHVDYRPPNWESNKELNLLYRSRTANVFSSCEITVSLCNSSICVPRRSSKRLRQEARRENAKSPLSLPVFVRRPLQNPILMFVCTTSRYERIRQKRRVFQEYWTDPESLKKRIMLFVWTMYIYFRSAQY